MMKLRYFLFIIGILNVLPIVSMEFEKGGPSKPESEEPFYLQELTMPLREALISYLVSAHTMEEAIENVKSFFTFAEQNKLYNVNNPEIIATIIAAFSKEWKLDKVVAAALLSGIPAIKELFAKYKELPGVSDRLELYLFELIAHNKPLLIQLLLPSVINLNAYALWISPKYAGFTPLTFAINENHVPIIEMLLKANADVNARDGFGNTPLIFAAKQGCIKGNVGIVEALLSAHADVNGKDKYGETALDSAVGQMPHYYTPQCVTLIKTLLEVGATGKPTTMNDVEALKKQEIWQQV